MRHQLSGRQLSRIAPHRWAMLKNMAASLLRHETIRTTLPKAKELRRVVEPLITLGKTDSDSNRRRAFSQLRDADVVVKLFEDLGPHFLTRPGGYTRILRMDPRPGDSAPMALMQLVDRAAATPAEDDETPPSQEGETEGTSAKKQPKKAAAPKRTSPKKKTVKSDAEKAEKAAKKQAKSAKADEKSKARAEKKAAAPKKKAAAKKKSSK